MTQLKKRARIQFAHLRTPAFKVRMQSHSLDSLPQISEWRLNKRARFQSAHARKLTRLAAASATCSRYNLPKNIQLKRAKMTAQVGRVLVWNLKRLPAF